MSSSKQLAPALTRTELAVWTQAFLAAELPTLLRTRKSVTPTGAAHLAADFADAAVIEYRLRKEGIAR